MEKILLNIIRSKYFNKLNEKYNLEKYIPIVLYLIFGAITTLVNIVAYITLTRVFNLEYKLSNVIAWIIAVLVAYITNKKYVFKTDNKHILNEFFKFILARVFSLLIDMLVMYIGINILNINDIIVKIVDNVIVIIVNYILSKFIIFKKD